MQRFKKIKSQRTNNPIIKWVNELTRQFSKEEIQMVNKYLKKCSCILSPKGNKNQNKNQNYTKIPSHPSQIGHDQENIQVLVRMQGKRNPHTLLVGI
jgi:hypothetical protein